MNIAESCIKNRVATLTVTVVLLFGGYHAFLKLGRLEDPEFTIKEAQVITQYPGATAAEVAEEVTDVLETSIQQLGQLKKVTSISKPGLSIIRAEMKDHYDKTTLPQVWDELRRKVNDAQPKLPPGASKSVVNDDYGDVYGVLLAVYGDGFSYAELLEYAKTLRRELLLVQDVAKVILYGDQQEVIYLDIPRARLAQLGIPPDLIRLTLSAQNQVAPAGNVEIGDQYVRINPTGEFTSLEDLGNLLILQSDQTNTKLYLRDIADIKRAYVDPPMNIMRFNGHRAIGLGISTVKGGNVVDMGTALKKRMAELMPEIPAGIEFGYVAVQADTVSKSIGDFLINLIEAVLIVLVVLLISMGMRSGLIIGFVLMLVILATFMIMNVYGVMLERVSLGALIIALGMLVDNAIVIVEGIQVGIQRKQDPIRTAGAIVKQTMLPLLAATFVAVLAFAPIGASQDKTGEYCRSLFQVLMYSLLLSWVLAITVTPLLSVMFLKSGAAKDGGDNTDPYNKGFFRVYRRFLEFCIRFRGFVIGLLAVLLVASFFGFQFVSKSFFPPSTRPQFMVHCWLREGTHILRTEAEVEKLEKFLLEQKGVTSLSSFVGQGAPRFLLTYQPEEPDSAYGLLVVSVTDYKAIPALFETLKTYARESAPDAHIYARKFVLGPGEPQKIQFRFRGYDLNVLRRLAEETKAVLRADGNIADITDDWRDRVPVVRPLVAETAARNAGLTRVLIAAALEQTFDGRLAGNYRERDLLLPILMRSPAVERNDVANLQDIRIWSPVADRSIPLAQVMARYETGSEDNIVRRRNRLPTITVKCDPWVGQAAPAFAAVRPKVEQRFEELKKELDLTGYSLEFGGEYEDSADAQSALNSKMLPIVLAMILILIVLFNSIRQAAVIFATVPLAIIGVTTGLLSFGQPFGFMALLGALSLSGMIIKNAVVLIDEINLNLSLGKSPYDSVVEAGVSRIRPVLNAAITTVFGVIPLAFDPFFAAMAVTIMVGLSFATVLTLVVVPIIYTMLYRIPAGRRARAPDVPADAIGDAGATRRLTEADNA
jgi:multidrug efflux pump subunit AcrB